MSFEIYDAKENEKEIILNLMQLYTYELSFFEDETTNFQLLDSGLYAMSKYIELYWKEENQSADTGIRTVRMPACAAVSVLRYCCHECWKK